MLAGHGHFTFEPQGLAAIRLRPLDTGRVAAAVGHPMKIQLRRSTQQSADLRRVFHPRHLHQNAVAALPGNAGFHQAAFIQPAAHHLQAAFNGVVQQCLAVLITGGHHNALVVLR